MIFKLILLPEAEGNLAALARSPSHAKRLKAVRKCLGLLETNLRHPGLHTHTYESLQGPDGEDVFEAYAENATPGAYRVFWYYGPGKGRLTIIAITPHPWRVFFSTAMKRGQSRVSPLKTRPQRAPALGEVATP